MRGESLYYLGNSWAEVYYLGDTRARQTGHQIQHLEVTRVHDTDVGHPWTYITVVEDAGIV